MKAIVEFGVRGDRHSKTVFPTAKAASEFAYKIAFVFGRDPSRDNDLNAFKVGRGSPRCSWQSSTHFVSVSILDGVPRGSDVRAWRPEVRHD
ncbi:hypothetical protein [Burkholderia multivorans]|uniref:hypothetical protein n=1 Tax=Burkholderia multivorans TaxID=87883 RepID=UPI0011B21999|nr:hypothetical protein [Burkholderia multivorans]